MFVGSTWKLRLKKTLSPDFLFFTDFFSSLLKKSLISLRRLVGKFPDRIASGEMKLTSSFGSHRTDHIIYKSTQQADLHVQEVGLPGRRGAVADRCRSFLPERTLPLAATGDQIRMHGRATPCRWADVRSCGSPCGESPARLRSRPELRGRR